MRKLVALLMMAGLSTPAAASQCVEVLLQDANGQMIAQVPPLVGFLMPGVGPVVNLTLEAGTRVYPGQATACPPDLIVAMKDIFEKSCVSGKDRAAVARENNQQKQDVNQRCQDLYKALNEK